MDFERARVALHAGAPAVQAAELGAEGVEAGLQNGGGGARVDSARRSGSAATAGSGPQRGEQRGAARVELLQVVEALVGDEPGLLRGQCLEGGPGAHATGGPDLCPRLAQLAQEAGDLVDRTLSRRGGSSGALAEDVDGLQTVGDLAGVHVQRGQQLVDDRLGAAELSSPEQEPSSIAPSAWRRKRPAPS